MTLISSNVFFNNIFSLFLSIYFILGFFSLKILMSMIVIIQSTYIIFIHQLFLAKSRKSTIYKLIYRVIVLMLSFSMFLLKLWNENFQPWILIKLYFAIYIYIMILWICKLKGKLLKKLVHNRSYTIFRI